MRYEDKHVKPISNRRFFIRLMKHGGAVVALIALSLWAGIAGYQYYEHLQWRDAFLDASMLLGGEGPVHSPQTPAGKVFAGCYALYAGLVFIVSAGVLFVPVIHRILHHLHWSEKETG